METLLNKINIELLLGNQFYDKFHGDLQFDNIIYNEKSNKFSYIDWRESFSDSITGGDLYYDLGKLYGGCILPYNLLKNDNYIELTEGISIINYNYLIPQALINFKKEYERWISENGLTIEKVKLIKSLIYLNMSPLHSDKFCKLLWFKAIEGLYECVNK